jgi:hypothetical protein
MNITENQRFLIKLIAGSILIPILVAYFTTIFTLSQQENILLLERINQAENIINNCIVEGFPNNETLNILEQSRYYWIYGNYNESERILNEVEYLVKGCALYLPRLEIHAYLELIIIFIAIFVYLLMFRKRSLKSKLQNRKIQHSHKTSQNHQKAFQQ